MIRITIYYIAEHLWPTPEHTLTPTRVHLPVAAHTVGIHNILESRCKFVGPYQRWRSAAGGDAIDKRRNRCAALSLKHRLQTKCLYGMK